MALGAFKKIDEGLRLKGLDSSPVALGKARARGLDVLDLDITLLTKSAVESLALHLGAFDLVLCLEVAEHLPPRHANKLLHLLTSYQTVIFSAAHPNQGGVLHVNEQPASYWIKRFADLKFRLSDKNEALRSQIKGLNLPGWYHQNINIFEKLL